MCFRAQQSFAFIACYHLICCEFYVVSAQQNCGVI